jgi:two-component system invasion response regulator UvrY
MLKILIADDHQIVRRGLKQILTEGFPFAEIDEAENTSTLIEKVLAHHWDIVITDLNMPGGGGVEALHVIKKHFPEMPVLILSIYPKEQYALRMIRDGAAGYLNKDAAPEELVKAVQHILSGKKFITEDLAEQLSHAVKIPAGTAFHAILSKREMAVFKLLAAGRSISDIAAELNLAVTTVSTYRLRIISKLNLKNNADLTQYALEHKLI